LRSANGFALRRRQALDRIVHARPASSRVEAELGTHGGSHRTRRSRGAAPWERQNAGFRRPLPRSSGRGGGPPDRPCRRRTTAACRQCAGREAARFSGGTVAQRCDAEQAGDRGPSPHPLRERARADSAEACSRDGRGPTRAAGHRQHRLPAARRAAHRPGSRPVMSSAGRCRRPLPLISSGTPARGLADALRREQRAGGAGDGRAAPAFARGPPSSRPLGRSARGSSARVRAGSPVACLLGVATLRNGYRRLSRPLRPAALSTTAVVGAGHGRSGGAARLEPDDRGRRAPETSVSGASRLPLRRDRARSVRSPCVPELGSTRLGRCRALTIRSRGFAARRRRDPCRAQTRAANREGGCFASEAEAQNWALGRGHGADLVVVVAGAPRSCSRWGLRDHQRGRRPGARLGRGRRHHPADILVAVAEAMRSIFRAAPPRSSAGRRSRRAASPHRLAARP